MSQVIPSIAMVPITLSGETASPQFIQTWQSQVTLLQNQITALQQVSNAQSAQTASIAAAQVTANTALSGSSGSISGTTTAVITNVTANTWQEGPVVSLTGVSAGHLTVNVNLAVGSGGLGMINPNVVSGGSGQTYYQVQSLSGIFRVVEVSSGAVFPTTGTWGFYSSISTNITGSTEVISNLSTTEIAQFSAALSTTGVQSYRLDFMLNQNPPAGASLSNVSATLLATRGS